MFLDKSPKYVKPNLQHFIRGNFSAKFSLFLDKNQAQKKQILRNSVNR